MTMALCSAFCALLGVLALECLMAYLLAVVALRWSWSVFEDTGHTGFTPRVEKSVGQKSSRVDAFGQVDYH